MPDRIARIAALTPLLLIVFIDCIGIALVLPLLAPILVDPQTSILPPSTSTAIRDLLYGIILSAFPLGMFFSSPILGNLSDRWGRKPVLLLSLIGTAGGYVLSAIGLTYHAVSLLLLGRIIDGLTAGSQSIAKASIIDISPANHKTQYLAWVLLAMSLGFIAGPLLGSLLSSEEITQHLALGQALPFWAISVLSLLNLLLLLTLYKDTSTTKSTTEPLRWNACITLFFSAFKTKKIRHLSIIMLLMDIGWAFYIQTAPLFLWEIHHFTPQQNGLFMSLMGLGFSLGSGILVHYFTKRITNIPLCRIAMFLVTFAMTCLMLSSNIKPIWSLSVVTAALSALAYAVLLSSFSDQASTNKQGWIMGIADAISALSFGIVAIATGVLINFSTVIPMWLGAFFSLTTGLYLTWIGHKLPAAANSYQ